MTGSSEGAAPPLMPLPAPPRCAIPGSRRAPREAWAERGAEARVGDGRSNPAPNSSAA